MKTTKRPVLYEVPNSGLDKIEFTHKNMLKRYVTQSLERTDCNGKFVLSLTIMLCGTTSSKKMAAMAEGVKERQTSWISNQRHLMMYMPLQRKR